MHRERGVIAGAVSRSGVADVEFCIAIGICHELLKSRRGAGSADEETVFLNAADHVHVDHRNGLLNQQRWMFGVVGGTEQPEFLACETDENDGMARTLAGTRQDTREFEDAAGARGVVVSAMMNLAKLARRKRVVPAKTEMIVVRANDDVLIRG